MDNTTDRIVDNDVTKELSDSFLEYSMSVIISRALPDVRDGLKPVHRRILYAMYNMGMYPEKPTRKSAEPVGETMGKYHPHGDSAIYEALVRLAQDFSMSERLIYPFGNFGSPDDGPAAARYTECKLDKAGMLLLKDLKEDTVDMVPNYSGAYMQPSVLPAAFPNLIVNGGSGIAVGMASNMAPHNLREASKAAQAMIKNPDITLEEIMEIMPGPDLPRGGLIMGSEGIKEAYRTGRGTFIMRGTATIEDITARRKGIVFNALPYGVGPEKVLEAVKRNIRDGKLQGVSDIKDLTNLKNGTKVVVECKTGFNPQAVLEELYRLTPLQSNFGINNVCLVGTTPQTLGMLDLLRYYILHRVEVITRRTQYRLDKAKKRAHILEGLMIALANIDEVVNTIKKSKSTQTARTNLTKAFKLTDVQADAILEMRLAQLTSLEVDKVKADLKALKEEIAGYEKILSSEANVKEVVSEELEEVAKTLGRDRQTRIIDEIPASKPVNLSMQIADEPVRVILNSNNLIGTYEVASSKGKPAKGDLIRSYLDTTTRSTIGAVTNTGRLLRANVVELPKTEGRSKGGAVEEFFDLQKETVVSLIAFDETKTLTLVTKKGQVKRVLVSALPKPGKPGMVITFKDDDELVGVHVNDNDFQGDLVIVTSNAQLLRTSVNAISPKGAPAGAMAGIKLAEEAEVIASGVISESDENTKVFTVSNNDGFKITKANDYPAKGRGGGGVRCQTFRKGETHLVSAIISDQEVYGQTGNGTIVGLPTDLARRDASGVKVETSFEKLLARKP